jgi:1-acyl-sn-glycerol-3-phosphate acyltransferase
MPSLRPARRLLLRSQVNRIVVLTSLLVILPSIVVAEQVRRGAGREVARRGVALVARLCGIRFEVRGQRGDTKVGAAVFVPNHSSPLDIPAMLVAVPEVRFLAAAELFRIPLLASAMRALGTVPVDRHHPEHGRQQLEEVGRTRSAGSSYDIAIFAEGGIAPAGGRLPFKSGAFSLAIRTGNSVVPVAIHGSDQVLPPHHRLAARPGLVTVELLEAVSTVGLTIDDRQDLRDRVRSLVTAAMATSPGWR